MPSIPFLVLCCFLWFSVARFPSSPPWLVSLFARVLQTVSNRFASFQGRTESPALPVFEPHMCTEEGLQHQAQKQSQPFPQHPQQQMLPHWRCQQFYPFFLAERCCFSLCSPGFRLSFLPLPLPAVANLRQSLPHLRNGFLATPTKDPWFFASLPHCPRSGAKAHSSALFSVQKCLKLLFSVQKQQLLSRFCRALLFQSQSAAGSTQATPSLSGQQFLEFLRRKELWQKAFCGVYLVAHVSKSKNSYTGKDFLEGFGCSLRTCRCDPRANGSHCWQYRCRDSEKMEGLGLRGAPCCGFWQRCCVLSPWRLHCGLARLCEFFALWWNRCGVARQHDQAGLPFLRCCPLFSSLHNNGVLLFSIPPSACTSLSRK